MPNNPAPEGAALPKLSPRHTVFVEQYFACNLNASAASRACKYANLGEGWRLLQRADVSAHVSARMAQFMPANEVLQRLTALARVSGEDFIETHTREVPVFGPQPLTFKRSNLEQKIRTLTGLDPKLFEGKIATLNEELAEIELTLALDPDATYQVQTGTRTEEYEVASLEAGRRSGKLFAVKKIKYGKDGLEFEWTTPLEALTLIGKHHKLFTEKIEHSGELGVIGIDFIMPGGDS